MPTPWQNPIAGLKTRRLDTGYLHARIHYSADPEKDDRWVRSRAAKYGGVEAAKWRREMEIDYSAVIGQPVYPMLDAIEHKEVKILDPENWAVYRVIDHGIRHPTVCLWVAVNRRGDRHVFREYYQTDKTIEFNVEQILRMTSEQVMATYIDPATKKRIGVSSKTGGDFAPTTIASEYTRCFHVCVRFADNSKIGYDKTRTALLSTLARNISSRGSIESDSQFAQAYMSQLSTSDLELMATKPALTFDPSCERCFTEMRNLRFKDLSGDPTEKAEPEEVMDFEDDGPDCVRYAMQSPLRYLEPKSQPEPGSPLDELNRKRRKRTETMHINRVYG